MGILERYISREFLKLLGLCLIAFVFLYLLVDFIEKSNTMFRYQATGMQVLEYFVYKIPVIVFQMIPVAILLSTLISLTILSKNSEIIAMKASGVSLYRIVAPLLVCAVLLSGFAFLLNEYVVPYTNERSEFVYQVEIKEKRTAISKKRKKVWYKLDNGILHIRTYYTQTNEMRDVIIFQFDDRFRLTQRIDAKKAVWTGKDWEFKEGVRREFDGNRFLSGNQFDSLKVALQETPEDFSRIAKNSDEMNYRELAEFIGRVEGEGLDVTRYSVDLQAKLSFPLVGIIMSLLAIPFALRTGRQGGVALGVGLAVGIGVIYWLFLGTFLSLGYSGALPSLAAAWGCHLLFGAIGIIMLMGVSK